jgi:hypothetical protein
MRPGNEARRPTASYLNVALALVCCAASLVLLAVPLIGLMFLPSLMGAACWASAALEDAGIID